MAVDSKWTEDAGGPAGRYATGATTACAGARVAAVFADDAAVRPVIVVGAGPVGLAAAIDLAQQGVPVVLLDDDDT
ncbi:hypothetical protein CA831_23745, partial [Burkholderia multivorans]